MQFHGFKQALDGEMKRLQAGGAGIEKKRAQPITNERRREAYNYYKVTISPLIIVK